MTQDELSMHDCTKGLEDGCSCDRIEIKKEDDGGSDDYGYDNYAQEERGATQF